MLETLQKNYQLTLLLLKVNNFQKVLKLKIPQRLSKEPPLKKLPWQKCLNKIDKFIMMSMNLFNLEKLQSKTKEPWVKLSETELLLVMNLKVQDTTPLNITQDKPN